MQPAIRLCIRNRGPCWYWQARQIDTGCIVAEMVWQSEAGAERGMAWFAQYLAPGSYEIEDDRHLPDLKFQPTPEGHPMESRALIEQKRKAAGIRDLIQRSQPQIAMALPKHLTPERMFRVAMTAVQKSPALLDCDPISLIGAIIQASQLGLEPDGVLGAAYLVPYGKQVQLIPGYRGLMDLARRSGYVLTIYAEPVYSGDEFRLTLGLDKDLQHTPAKGDRGEFVGAYAVAKLRDGTREFVWMTKTEIDAIRRRSKASGSGPWVTDYVEMAKKTAIRRLCKTLPRSVEYRDVPVMKALDRATDLQEQAEAGEAWSVSDLTQLPPPEPETEPHDPAPENLALDSLMTDYRDSIFNAPTEGDVDSFVAKAESEPMFSGKPNCLEAIRDWAKARKGQLAAKPPKRRP